MPRLISDGNDDVKRLRLGRQDRAVLLRSIGVYLDTLPHPKRGARWEEASAQLAYERRKVVSLAFALTAKRPQGGRRERHTWRLEDEVDSAWCRREAEMLDREAPGTS